MCRVNFMLKTTAPFMSPEFLENKTRITRPSDLHLITTFSLRALRTCDFVFIDGVQGRKCKFLICGEEKSESPPEES